LRALQRCRRIVELVGGILGEDFDVRPAAGTGSGDYIRQTIAVHVASRDPHSTCESCRVGHEFVQDGSREAVEDLHMWASAFAWPGDDVGLSIAVYIADGYVHAA